MAPFFWKGLVLYIWWPMCGQCLQWSKMQLTLNRNKMQLTLDSIVSHRWDCTHGHQIFMARPQNKTLDKFKVENSQTIKYLARNDQVPQSVTSNTSRWMMAGEKNSLIFQNITFSKREGNFDLELTIDMKPSKSSFKINVKSAAS